MPGKGCKAGWCRGQALGSSREGRTPCRQCCLQQRQLLAELCVSALPQLPAAARASDFRKEDNESPEKHSYICDSAADRRQNACTAPARHLAGPALKGWEGPPVSITCQLSWWHCVLSWQWQRLKLRLEEAALKGRRCKQTPKATSRG